MNNDKFMNLQLQPSMTMSQFLEMLMKDFEKTGLNMAEFDIAGTDGKNQFLLNFNIRLITVNERKH